MKKSLTMAVLLPLFFAGSAWAGSVEIISPKDGEMVKNPVEVEVAVEKGDGLDHYHLFVDGEMIKPVMSRKTTVSLTPGNHTLKAWGTSASHKLLDVSDEVAVMAH